MPQRWFTSLSNLFPQNCVHATWTHFWHKNIVHVDIDVFPQPEKKLSKIFSWSLHTFLDCDARNSNFLESASVSQWIQLENQSEYLAKNIMNLWPRSLTKTRNGKLLQNSFKKTLEFVLHWKVEKLPSTSKKGRDQNLERTSATKCEQKWIYKFAKVCVKKKLFFHGQKKSEKKWWIFVCLVWKFSAL